MHAKSNIARLYLSRRKWGIGLIRPDVERKKKRHMHTFQIEMSGY